MDVSGRITSYNVCYTKLLRVDVVIFRENTEDVYAGIEYASGTPENQKLAGFLREQLGAQFFEDAGLAIKPISPFGSKRLIRKV